MAELSLSGLASGFDWKAVVDQLTDLSRARQRTLKAEQTTLNSKRDAISSLITELTNFKSKADTINSTTFFSTRSTKSNNEVVATASSTESTPTGTYKFEITQLATHGVRKGASNAGGAINTTAAIGSAGFALPVTPGTFTINNKTFTFDSTATVSSIISLINAQTATTNVTASYSAATDKITLSASSGTIALGHAGDTSNFLQAARLANNSGTATSIVSSQEIGGVNLSAALSAVNFSTALSATTPGEFRINGVSITYNTSDTLATVLGKITDSTAGVTASYDSFNDRFLLTAKNTGDLGLSLTDVTGNFLAATKLSTGTTEAGQNLKFKLNGGALTESLGNKITEASHGIAGLVVDALKLPASESNAADGALTTSTTGTTSLPNRIIDQWAVANDFTVTEEEHGYTVGTEVQFVQGAGATMPANFNTTSTYFVGSITGANKFKLFPTRSDALAGTNEIDPGAANTNPGDLQLKHISPLETNASTGSGKSSTSTSTTVNVDEVIITVAKDSEKIKKTIAEFIDNYNKIQSLIETQTNSSTDAKGKVSAGVLAGNREVAEIASELRSMMVSDVDTSVTIKRLESIGYKSGGFTNQLSLADAGKLDDALSNYESQVKELFNKTTTGIATKVKSYLDRKVGTNGTFIAHRDNMTKQSGSIDTQIADHERQVQSERQRMISSFIAMEKAQAQINQQLQFLTQRFK